MSALVFARWGCRAATKVRKEAAVAGISPSRGFWGSWGANKKATEDRTLQERLVELAARDLSPTPPGPMLESQNPAIKQLAQQYARSSKGCGKCPEKREGSSGIMSFSCPKSGFPSHCKEECYTQDSAHHAVADDLRMIHLDYADLRSGRVFHEFDFPGQPPHDFGRSDYLSNWVSFLSEREFKNALNKKMGWARTDEEKFIEARSIRAISSVFTFPLTISHAIYWKSALGDPGKLDSRKDDDGKQIPQRITILGPRAEAVLPTRAWLELNAIFPEAAFELHFVGPEIPDDKHEQVLNIPQHKLSLKWTKALYQDVHEFHELPDLFVIFNSGIGHFEAGATWNDALELLFNKSDFKTVLFTSHSKDDSARDYSALSRRQDCRFLTHPAMNPFMSFKKDVAVTDLKYIINSNHTYMLVRGSPPDGVIPGNTVWEKLQHVLK